MATGVLLAPVVARAVVEAGHDLVELRIDPPSLETVFLHALALCLSTFVALGLLVSTISPSPTVAASVGLTLAMVLVVGDVQIGPAPTGLAATADGLSPLTHLDAFSRGLVSLSDVCWFLLVDLAALAAAAGVLRHNRRSGS